MYEGHLDVHGVADAIVGGRNTRQVECSSGCGCKQHHSGHPCLRAHVVSQYTKR